MSESDSNLSPQRVSILLPDLRGGGVERMRIYLSRYFLSKGCKVDFVLMHASGELLAQRPESARVVALEVHRISKAFWPLVRYLRQTRPDVLLVGMWPLTIIGILAHRLTRISGRVIVSDHNNLSSTPLANSLFKRLVLRFSMRFVYPRADARLAVSQGVADDLSALSGLKRDTFNVIYNPVVDPSVLVEDDSNPWEGFSGKRILSVGSLKAQKDHATLIKAFALVKDKIESTLVILGEGCLRPELEQLIVSLGLVGSVHTPGFISEPTPWYIGADLFVLSSRWEGFGNVIVEALTAGTPVVSTDCPSGPREILEDGRYGLLVPMRDAEALAEGMMKALQLKPDCEVLKARARDFTIGKIGQQYLDVMFPKVGGVIE